MLRGGHGGLAEDTKAIEVELGQSEMRARGSAVAGAHGELQLGRGALAMEFDLIPRHGFACKASAARRLYLD